MAGRSSPRRTRQTGCPGGGESRRRDRSSPCQTSWRARWCRKSAQPSRTRNLRHEALSAGIADRGLDAAAVVLAGSRDAVAVRGLPRSFVALKASAQPTAIVASELAIQARVAHRNRGVPRSPREDKGAGDWWTLMDVFARRRTRGVAPKRTPQGRGLP